MYKKSFNILEVETRFLISDERPFSTLESRITQYLDASKGISIKPATDLYFDPSKDFSESERNKEFQRLRNHVVYENGVPSVKKTKQIKRMVKPVENRYGIEAWLETSNHVVRDLNKEIENLTKQGYHFLNVHGDRNVYSIEFRNSSLEMCFDRMLSPKGEYIEVGTERKIKTPEIENIVQNSTKNITDFINTKLKKLLDDLKVETKVKPIYPLILLK